MEIRLQDELMLNKSILIMRQTYEALKSVTIDQAGLSIMQATDNDLSQQTKNLLHCRNAEQLRFVYGRKDSKDTIIIDALAESSICLGGTCSNGHYSAFQQIINKSGVVVTEERGRVPSDRTINRNTPIIISDPIDGSDYIEEMIKEHGDSCKTIGDVFAAELKKLGKAKAELQSPNSSVTYLVDNHIKYAVILNLLTGTIYIAYGKGVFSGDINTATSSEEINNPVIFKENGGLSMICYSKNSGCYASNLVGTALSNFQRDVSIVHPVGPMRFGYLISKDRQAVHSVGVVAFNGEKIQEALPSMAVALFSKGNLLAWKLFCQPDMATYRSDKALAPVLSNSLYYDNLIQNTGINMRFLDNHKRPSEFRDTTVILPKGNTEAVNIMKKMVEDNRAIRII